MPSELTNRQRQIAGMFAEGQTYAQIGRELGIAEATVKIHIHNARERLHAKGMNGRAFAAIVKTIERRTA